ncbi:hypothetical protein RCC89_20035 [Cytophagaceae bacterium ABcell3]|nr:hypothetical protein RCC89_20035 [Cytophagaceae bacterium ABcell3]
MKNVPVFVFVLLIATACLRNQALSHDEVKEVIIDKNFDSRKADADVKVLTATVEGDVLSVELECDGCGAGAAFDMVNDGKYMKSLPPGTYLYPVKTSDGRKSETGSGVYKYDISSLQYHNTNSIFLLIKGYDDRIMYKY